jgi:hypothetical protein
MKIEQQLESLFLNLTLRNISHEIFFNSLLSDGDLSKLLSTCRGMKEMILKWKQFFPIQEFTTGEYITDKMFENMILHYSRNIKKLTISGRSRELTLNGYDQHVALLHLNLLELDCLRYFPGAVTKFSSSLLNLTSLRLLESTQSYEDLESISQLTNLRKLELDSCLDLKYKQFSLEFLSTLTQMKSISISRLSGNRLDCWLEKTNKQILVELKIDSCSRISAEEYHCLSTLTDLTLLSFTRCKVDDIGLNLICSSCHHIANMYLDYNDRVTRNGLNNFHFLVNLTSLFASLFQKWESFFIMEKICHNVTLTHLTMYCDCEGTLFLHNNLSNLINLTYLSINGIHSGLSSNVNLSPTTKQNFLSNLTILELNNVRIQKLDYLTSLTKVNIHKSYVNVNAFRQLSSLVYLSHLKMTGCSIYTKEFSNLSFCTNLTFLDLSISPSYDHEICHLSSLIKLTHLELCGLRMTDAGLCFLMFINKTLTYLKIEGYNMFKIIDLEKGYKYLASCRQLTNLTLTSCYFENGLSFLKGMLNLSHLNIDPTFAEDEDLIMIKTHLTKLTIFTMGLGRFSFYC